MTDDARRFVRSQRAALADLGDHVYVIARDSTVRRIEGDSAALARAVIAFVATPRTREQIVAHVESLAAAPLGDGRAVLDGLLDLLVETGAVSIVASAATAVTRSPRSANIVVCVTGAIAATHAPALVMALQRRGHTVEVALTESAPRFVSVDALGAIAGREIHTTLWPGTPHAAVPHVALAGWADLVVVYPASATTISRMAHGDFSDLVSAIALTTRAPVMLAPSMNVAMLSAPAVQRNLEMLREDGCIVVHPIPSEEVAEAPSVRGALAAAAPAPSELAATIDALLSAGALSRAKGRATTAADWDAIYKASGASVPWATATCDEDIAAVLASHAKPSARLLDVGCGFAQVARHAASLGFDVVATDISATALQLARDTSADARITFLRDDICATNLVGPFDVIVDRATLHTLPASRLHAWAASICRLTAPGTLVIVKAHRASTDLTTGYTPESLAERLPDFDLMFHAETRLPAPRGPSGPSAGDTMSPLIPAVTAVFQRRAK